MEQVAGKLDALLALWHQARGTRPMPARGDLPLSALLPWLDSLSVIELSAPVPYFRLCGNRLHLRFGGAMTGYGPDAPDDAHGRSELAHRVAEACRTRAPVKAVHLLPGLRGPVVFSELYLPLGADARRTDLVLFASYAAC